MQPSKESAPTMILLWLFMVVTADDKGSLERGVFFHEETKILLAEKFVNAQFLVPYPKFEIQLTENLDKVAKELQNMWQMPTSVLPYFHKRRRKRV